jgi:hypothetical protein
MNNRDMEIDQRMFIEAVERIKGIQSRDYAFIGKIFSEFTMILPSESFMNFLYSTWRVNVIEKG